MKQFLVGCALVLLAAGLQAQSLEVMGGHERIFADVQWLKNFDEQYRWTLFSRSRATVDYESNTNTNVFSGAYLNYTSGSGIGATVVGRIATRGAGADVGVHYFKSTEQFLVYALLSGELQDELGVSWFSILRYRPALNEQWKLYTSLELFSNFDEDGHAFSVQRIRAGVERWGFQFGPAINLSGAGQNYAQTDSNAGAFLRKEF